MKEIKEFPQKRPFHKTIVEAILKSETDEEALCLVRLLGETSVSEGHDAIIKAIDKRFDFGGARKWENEFRIIKNNLLKEKEICSQ